MKSVLMVHPRLTPNGGGQTVGAWTLQALKGRCRITLLTLEPVEWPAINQHFGVDLSEEGLEVVYPPKAWTALVGAIPTPTALLENGMLMRVAQSMARSGRFDQFLSTSNEIDFGRPGVQYVHYPYAYRSRPENDYHWFHRIPGVLGSYRRLADWVSGASLERIRANRALVNSRYIEGVYRDAHGVGSTVVPPPVPGDFPDVPWEERKDVIVGIGRMHPCKRWIEAMEIVGRVRKQGVDLKLLILGSRDIPEFMPVIEEAAARTPWCELALDLPREEMVRRAARCRYGIHLMVEEHFGIAPAELQRGGCLTFAHNSGGPIEILGGDSDVLFDSDDDAVRKIVRMMRDEALRERALERMRARAETYSEETFVERIRAEVLG